MALVVPARGVGAEPELSHRRRQLAYVEESNAELARVERPPHEELQHVLEEFVVWRIGVFALGPNIVDAREAREVVGVRVADVAEWLVPAAPCNARRIPRVRNVHRGQRTAKAARRLVCVLSAARSNCVSAGEGGGERSWGGG